MTEHPIDTTATGDSDGDGFAAGTAPLAVAGSAQDNSFDLSLRLLTALVVVALIGSVGLLTYRWIAPRLDRGDTGPVTTRLSRPPPPTVNADQGPVHGDQVLMDPGRVFRCEDQGRVSFSDQACPGASGTGTPPATRPR